jgi:hypothetical protein
MLDFVNKHELSQIKKNCTRINILVLFILNKKEKQAGTRSWVAIFGKW